MKKLFLSFAFLALITISSFAQLEKGSIIGGVNGNFSLSTNTPEIKLISWSFDPYAMYLVRNNLALGLSLDNSFQFGDSHYSYENEHSRQTIYNVKFAPTIRNYFGSGKFRPYIGVKTGLALYYYKNNFSSDSYSYIDKSSHLAVFLNPEVGVSYWLNDKVFFDLKASYDLLNSYKDANYGFKSFDVKLGIGIKLGK
jgi:hypothetical protein